MDDAVRAFVSGARVGRLATASPAGVPHVVPVCFALEGEVIYIAVDEKPKRVPPERLRRVRNLVANANVQLVVDHYEEDWSRLAFVQVTGMAALLEGGTEHGTALGLLREKYRQYAGMALESRPLIRIAITSVTSWGALY